MTSLPELVCRVCLDGNVTMYCIANTELQELYEKLANTTLNAGDGRPETICYICYSQLQKCHRFSKLSRKTEEILLTLLNNGYEVTNETVGMLDYGNGMKKKFSVDVIGATVLPPPPLIKHYAHNDVAVKEEFIETEEKPFVEDDEIDSLDEAEQPPNKEEIVIDSNLDVNKPYADTCNKKYIAETQFEGNIIGKCLQGDDKRFIHKNELTEYTKKQPKKKPYYACGKCNDTFTNKRYFSKHIQLHNPKKSITPKGLYCDMCKKTFPNRNRFCVHMRNHARIRAFACYECNKAFKYKNNLERHIKIHTGEKPYVCDTCGKTFRQKIHLTGHMLIHTKEKRYTCNLCNKKFTRKCTFLLHIQSHTAEKRNTCRKIFSQEGLLRIHSKVHSGEKQYACDKCDKAYYQRGSLKYHLKTHLELKEARARTVFCQVCGKAFFDKSTLSKHIKIHSGERPYACDKCDKAYIQRCNLISHLRTHLKVTNIKPPLVCHVCGKTFQKLKLLNVHLKNHLKVKPFACDICDKTFPDKTRIRYHMRKHTGERPYSCSFCDKKFALSAALRSHMRIHTGEKPYACNACDKTFTQKNSLDYHKRKQH